MNKNKYFVTEKDFSHIISVLNAYNHMNAEIKTALYLMFYTGAKSKDLEFLKNKDINADKRFIIYSTPSRVVLFPESIVKNLLYYKVPEYTNEKYFSFNQEKIHGIIRILRTSWKKNFLLESISLGYLVNLIKLKLDPRIIKYLTGRELIEVRHFYKMFPLSEIEMLNDLKEKLK